MTEPSKENERLATRLAAIAAALSPPAKANGDGASDREYTAKAASHAEIATAVAFLNQSEGGRQALTLLRGVIRDDNLEVLIRSIAKGVGSHVAAALAPLKQRIGELEAKRQVTYEGIWDAERSYVPGQLCTFHGSIWHCERSCAGVSPDTSAGADTWVLAVKKGRDARDRK